MSKATGTRREKALKAIEIAREQTCLALSLLGGTTRQKPKRVTKQFIARQYLESIDQRLSVTEMLVLRGEELVNPTSGSSDQTSLFPDATDFSPESGSG